MIKSIFSHSPEDTSEVVSFLKKHVLIVMFVALYTVMSLLTYKDFGLTWDEPVNYNRGVISFEYLFNKRVINPFKFNKINGSFDIREKHVKIARLRQLPDVTPERLYDYCHYSGFYPMLLFVLNKNKTIEVYHFLNMLFSIGVFVAIYLLLYHKYRHQKLAILGPLTLFYMPRFIGHIPGNPKDVPFAVMYFISCTAIYFFALRRSVLTKILVLGLLFGITQNLRIAGITLIAVMGLFDLYVYYLEKRRDSNAVGTWKQFFINEVHSIILIAIVATLFSVLTWPYLGMNVITHGMEILGIKSSYQWEGTVLYQGKLVEGAALAGHYLLTWFIITIPLAILLPATLSPFLIKKRFQNRIFVLLVVIIAINITLFALVRPIVYDGLRHFLFILPPLSVLGAMAIIEYFQNAKKRLIKICIGMILIFNALLISKEIVSLHPYEYIFFNSFVGGLQGAYKKYDTDYWGASYNEAINWFKENIATDENRIYKVHIRGIKRYVIYQASNIKKTDFSDAEYLFYSTRRMESEPKKEDIIHIVQRNNVPLVYILKADVGMQ